MVEHLLAALGGLGVNRGLSIEVEGDEVPLLDGAAARWCSILDELGVPASPRPTRVARAGEVQVEGSRYRFFEGEGSRVSVELVFPGLPIEPHASWDGGAEDFRARIAPARTFVLARELEALAAGGMMAHVAPESVVLIGDGGLTTAGPKAAPDEPARHKLLDFIGDTMLYGGPPEGRVEAYSPGHAANHEAMRQARAMGIVVDR